MKQLSAVKSYCFFSRSKEGRPKASLLWRFCNPDLFSGQLFLEDDNDSIDDIDNDISDSDDDDERQCCND